MNGFIKESDAAICQMNQMKLLFNLCLFVLAGSFPVVGAQLQLVAPAEPQSLFFGKARSVSVMFSNSTGLDFQGEIRTRIYQASSSTAILLSDESWKSLAVPASETVLDAAALDFPAVKAKTQFLVQWLEETDHVIGTTVVLVYPTNLFKRLPPFDKNDFGVFDPGNCLKPLLKAGGIPYLDLGEAELDHFSGRLAIIGPFESKAQMSEGLSGRISTMAEKNVAVVWLQPPPSENDRLNPSFYSVQKSQTAVLVAQADLVSRLAENPRSQLNLISLCQQALYPRPAALSDLTPQP
jgi:hypothetical protein